MTGTNGWTAPITTPDRATEVLPGVLLTVFIPVIPGSRAVPERESFDDRVATFTGLEEDASPETLSVDDRDLRAIAASNPDRLAFQIDHGLDVILGVDPGPDDDLVTIIGEPHREPDGWQILGNMDGGRSGG